MIDDKLYSVNIRWIHDDKSRFTVLGTVLGTEQGTVLGTVSYMGLHKWYRSTFRSILNLQIESFSFAITWNNEALFLKPFIHWMDGYDLN